MGTKGSRSAGASKAGATRAAPLKAASKRGRPVVRIPLAEAREKRCLSLSDLAAVARVDRQTVWRIEQGVSSPYPMTRRRLAEALEMEVDRIAWPDRVRA